ncbi:class III extradiol ring-cleavage dioxygenase [Terasakiella sp. A23]|uniref:DODA-type extradiol aromatic ring-opening family dioxygenase n=1 Tax=Terasakiella sp. FCG-A23 TaxID=3080561 RepID=UPI0029539EAB|nr:class III extradiol ring-cleavage dioxygenase [Terasakiella sp. A23]MDV7337964.1 class III extradiol ring-cleavage dioxygenase [Terasakiella sp. A23]
MMPSLFISHGSPTVLIEEDSAGRAFLSGLAEDLPRPKAILVISAHWETRSLTVTGAEEHKTIHDFYGFPEALFQMHYPARGSSELTTRLQGLLDAHIDPVRGLDHGAWSPLKLIYPNADIPVVQLGLQSGESPAYLYQLGEQLKELRNEGVLIIGSGAVTHNLGEIRWNSTQPDDWAQAYEDWFVEKLESGDKDALLNAHAEAPHFTRAHPRDEHWLPLYVAMGAGDTATLLHRGFEHGNLSMAAVRFD